MIELSIDGERWPMIADDLRRLPSSPLIVAEGMTVRPRLVSAGIADPARAVWLLPTPQFRRDRLEERGWSPSVAEFHRLQAIEIEREIAEVVVAVLRTGGQTVEETLALVEERFAQPLLEGPRAASRVRRRALIRYANAAVVAQVRAYYARPWADGDADSVERAFACECGDPGCVEDVELPVGAFPAGPLLAGGHR